MNNFNKTYTQLAKTYNLNTDNLYLEAGFLETLSGWGKKIWNIIKKGPTALFELVKGWFTSSKDEESAKHNASLATKLINFGSDEKIVTESIMPKWFTNMCNTVKHSITFMSSDKEKQEYLNYLKNDCKIDDKKWKAMSFSEKKDNFSKFANKELENNKIITEEIITEMTLLATCIGFLVVVIIGIGIFEWVGRNIIPMNKRQQAIYDTNIAKAEAEKDKELQNIELQKMIDAFKDCGALK